MVSADMQSMVISNTMEFGGVVVAGKQRGFYSNDDDCLNVSVKIHGTFTGRLGLFTGLVPKPLAGVNHVHIQISEHIAEV